MTSSGVVSWVEVSLRIWVATPTLVGRKPTLNVVVSPGISTLGTVGLSIANGDAISIGLKLIAARSQFWTVTCCELRTSRWIGDLPKFRAGGAIALPLSMNV